MKKIHFNLKIGTKSALLIILAVAFLVGAFSLWQKDRIEKLCDGYDKALILPLPKKVVKTEDKKPRPKPLPVSMKRVKTQGCVTDGLLTDYNPDSGRYVRLIDRSNCYYLHRAIETWLKPPDFDTVEYFMDSITKKDVVYGMFIAEAIDTHARYREDSTGHEFDFDEMCRKGSENAWGEHTCKPTFSSKEYRRYLQYTTHKAIDLGVQSFMFGQIYMQESGEKDYAKMIVDDMRSYADSKGIDIIVGAQTGSITDSGYIKIFDYVEGGVGLAVDGSVEEGPCLSWRGSCWALLWHNEFSGKAKNVLLHLDWTGIKSDDLDVFARMDAQTRADTLRNLYKKFTSQNMGFLMPVFGVLDHENGGCYGPKKRFYSPDNSYSCKDEDVINGILGGK